MHLFFRHNCTRHHQVHLAETVQTIYITEAKKKKTPTTTQQTPPPPLYIIQQSCKEHHKPHSLI